MIYGIRFIWITLKIYLKMWWIKKSNIKFTNVNTRLKIINSLKAVDYDLKIRIVNR